jgi:uncharacterized protein
MRPPFLVDVTTLRRHQGRRERVVTGGIVPGMAVTECMVPDQEQVSVDVTLESVDGGVIASGEVRAPWAGACRRCLRPLTGEVVAQVEEVFSADAEEGEAYPLVRNQLDLEPLAREAIVLGLPLAPLCQEDCRGLCPVCGADKNELDCGHTAAASDSRWTALDALRRDT